MEKAPEWLDIVVKGKMAQINSQGDIREATTKKETNKKRSGGRNRGASKTVQQGSGMARNEPVKKITSPRKVG